MGRILLVFFSSHVRKPSAHGRHIVDIHHANFFIFTSSFPNVFFCIEPSTFLHIFCSFFIYLKYIPVTSETNTSRRLPTCCFFTLLYFHFSADVEKCRPALFCFMDIYIEMGGSLVICVVFRGGSLNEGLTQKASKERQGGGREQSV